ncbi:MAG: hypothetical protein K6C40_14495 [Thermoguttaceae bacterium]|nr:hypothetical protein [Thermoguttaceae bacterium]
MTKFIPFFLAAALMALAPFTMAQEKKSFWHVPTPTDAQHVKAAAPFTLTDYHIHLRLGTTCVKAIERQEATGIQSGILENSGREWPLFDDASLLAFIRYNRKIMAEKGVKLPIGMQVNDRDWFTYFSPDVLKQLDYVLADTMIMDDENGQPVRLWRADTYVITDEEAWMERYFRHTMQILDEPITILANPTYLPAQLADRYDHFWTEERMKAVIDRAVKNGVALEIQAKSTFPSVKFIKMAKAAGATFSVGTNNGDGEIIPYDRWFRIIEECGLEEKDFLKIRY